MSNIEQKVGIDRLADALSSLATKVKAIKSVDDLKNFASINEFDTQAQDGQLGTYEKDGHPVILLKYAGIPHEFVDREVLEQYVNSQILLIKNDLEADDFEKLNKILDFTFGANTTGGAVSYIEHFGDLDDTTTRQNFMDNVKINNWYTFNIGGNPYQVVITSGDKTSNFQWVGKRVIDGPLGKTPEIVKGSTSSTGHAETSAGLTGEFFSNTLALPDAYPATQMLPKSTIEQMIIDSNQSTVNEETDPTWQDLDGTQATLFNPSQITITLTDSGIVADENIQFLLGSTGGNLVLDASVKIYDDVTEAARNGNVAGTYKWYAYAVSATEVKFVMEDSAGGLTDTSQTIAKIRRVSPNVQRFTGHYTSQAAVLKGAVNITGVNTGASQEITLPNGLTTDDLTGIALTVSGSTDWYEVEGWDKVTAFYVSVTNEASNQVWWVEYKIEAVPGDKTKLKVTNFKSGNVGTDNATYNAHWIAFKGGK